MSGTADSPQWWTSPFVMSLFKNLLIGFGFLALMMFVVKPLLNSLRSIRQPKMDILESLAPEHERLSGAERAHLAVSMAEQQDLMEKAKTNPYQVAQILQNWITEDK
jgi:flagellar M-ring protein FliF